MTRKMKDSGVEWIGEIPEEWSIVKVKSLFELGRGRVIAQTELKDDGLYPVYSSQTKNNGCLGYIDTYDFDKKQLTWTTDGANAGTVFLREGKYNCTNVCGTLLPRTNDNLKFLKYDLEYIAIYHKRLDTNGYKIMNNEMAEIRIVRPKLCEQNKISEYLDYKCTKIDQTIEKEKQVIEKLKEYKQSIITEAVTKGLNPDAPMKDSGVDWIGEIPEHWNIKRIKNILIFNPTYSENFNDKDNVSFIPMECLKNDKIEPKISELSKVKGGYTYFANGDIIMAKVTPCFENGNIAVAKDLINGIGFGSSELYVFRCNKSYNRYIFYYLQNIIFKQRCVSTMYGTGGLKRVSSNFVFNYKLAVPNNDEQQEIADYLDKKCSAIDKLISNKEKVIEKLTEYKKSLIYECVTGKREVQ